MLLNFVGIFKKYIKGILYVFKHADCIGDVLISNWAHEPPAERFFTSHYLCSACWRSSTDPCTLLSLTDLAHVCTQPLNEVIFPSHLWSGSVSLAIKWYALCYQFSAAIVGYPGNMPCPAAFHCLAFHKYLLYTWHLPYRGILLAISFSVAKHCSFHTSLCCSCHTLHFFYVAQVCHPYSMGSKMHC